MMLARKVLSLLCGEQKRHNPPREVQGNNYRCVLQPRRIDHRLRGFAIRWRLDRRISRPAKKS